MSGMGSFSAEQVRALYSDLAARASSPSPELTADVAQAITLVQRELVADGRAAFDADRAGDAVGFAAGFGEQMADARVLSELKALGARLSPAQAVGVALRPAAPAPTPAAAPAPAPVAAPAPAALAPELTPSQKTEVAKAVGRGINNARANSIFDQLGWQLSGDRLRVVGFVSSPDVLRTLGRELQKSMDKASRDKGTPQVRVDVDSVRAGNDSMVGWQMREAIVRHLYRQGQRLEPEDWQAAGIGMGPWHQNNGPLVNNGRDFGIFIDAQRNVTMVYGDVMFPAQFPFVLRDALRSHNHGDVRVVARQ